MERNLHTSFLKVFKELETEAGQLAIIAARGKKSGPTVWLTAGVHGDEAGGTTVVHNVMKRFAGGELERGTVFALPLMNPSGFREHTRNIPESGEDLNRLFPGKENGSLGERIAHAVFTAITETEPAAVFDLHNDWIASIPYALVDPYPGLRHRRAYETAKRFAKCTGLIAVHEEEKTEGESWKKTLSGSLLLHGVPSLTSELGSAYIGREVNASAGALAVWSVLAELGMVEPETSRSLYPAPEPLHNKMLVYSDEPRIETHGIIEFLVKPGDVVKKEQALAHVYDEFGELRETVRAVHDGILLGHSDSSAAHPGMEAFGFAVIKN